MNKSLLSYHIQSYLHTYSSHISNVYLIEKNENFEYTCVCFRYLKHNIEIRIYNDTFIKFRVDGRTIKICSDIHSIRQSIDNLQIHLWEY